MSLIESGKVYLHPEPINTHAFLTTIKDIVQPIALEKGVRLHIIKKFNDITCIRFDMLAMQQILINLLSNAIKFSKEKAVVNLIFQMKHNKRGASLTLLATGWAVRPYCFDRNLSQSLKISKLRIVTTETRFFCDKVNFLYFSKIMI